jgi:hypothetical protein
MSALLSKINHRERDAFKKSTAEREMLLKNQSHRERCFQPTKTDVALI